MQEEENYATTKVILLKVDNLDNLLSYHYNYYQLSEPLVNIMIELFHYNIGKCLLKRTTAILPELFYA